MKEEQRSRFEQLEHLVEETRGMVEIQVGHKNIKKIVFVIYVESITFCCRCER